jgi:hypothetical protein
MKKEMASIGTELWPKYRQHEALTIETTGPDNSAGLSLVQFRELLGNRRINELSLRFRVGSLTFCSVR